MCGTDPFRSEPEFGLGGLAGDEGDLRGSWHPESPQERLPRRQRDGEIDGDQGLERFARTGQDARNGMEASLLGAEIDKLYILWGVEEVQGLELDGVPATAESLIERGPEELFGEALAAVKIECGLTENERKN